MKLLRSILPLLVGVLAVTAGAAFGEDMVHVGKKGEVEFQTPMRVGQTLLPAGHYQFQHEMTAEGHHVLVVRAQAMVPSSGGHYGGKTAKEPVARIPCDVAPLDRKSSSTGIVYKTGSDGVRELTQIRIAGEKSGHILTLTPAS
jgi:hypothetical protein